MSNEIENIPLPNLGSAVWNNRYKALFTGMALFSVALAFFILAPREYGSEGKVFVQLGRGSIGLDPSVSTSATISLNESRETEINSILEVMRSRELAGIVADDVGIDKILESKWDSVTNPVFDLIGSLKQEDIPTSGDLSLVDYEASKRREKAIQKLMENTTIDAKKRTTLIYVWATAESPLLAQEIAASYLKNFQQQHVEINSNENSLVFFDEHFEERKAKVAEAERDLSDFRSKHGMLSIEGSRNLLQTKIDKLQLDIQDTEASMDASNAKIEEFVTQLGALDERVKLSSRKIANTTVDQMRDRLSQLEVERITLAASLPPGHTKLSAKDEAIAKVREKFEQMEPNRDEDTTEINPNFIALQNERLSEEGALSGLKKKRESLTTKLKEARVELKDLNEKELVSVQLQRDIDILQNEFQAYAKGRAEASRIRQLDEESISNVKVWQPAHLILKHISPRGSIVLPLGAAFALIGALLVALIAESRRMRKIEPRDIEERLEMPILVDIPRVTPSQTIMSS